jgi:hypothetical protein
MKTKPQLKLLPLFLWLGTFGQVLAQNDTIQVSPERTTYLLFNQPVDLVDIGLTQAYVARIEGACVFIKALQAGAAPTTLLVRSGNDYFSAHLQSHSKPPKSLYDYRGRNLSLSSPTSSESTSVTSVQLEQQLDRIRPAEGKVIRQTKQHRVSLSLIGMYNDPSATYLVLRLRNRSSIPYRIDYVGFERVEKRGRRFSANNLENQETVPLGVVAPASIGPHLTDTLRYALPLYAFGSRGKLRAMVREANGSRTLQLSIPGRLLNQAPSLEQAKR